MQGKSGGEEGEGEGERDDRKRSWYMNNGTGALECRRHVQQRSRMYGYQCSDRLMRRDITQ